ncbi:MinD/ParA family ATP-binding protein [Limnoglobus roseus]|uniref:MinD/ParA family protein n=1 Tax=Limnoglobus roseus TaxID=2598579 RepID=A0A5C1AQJ8_9BACT|nr:MinD/ParA family protein [Limnoglobus roseus]QEL19464.1 MinD/ParA family protein [Limnoglobus roseus]
MAQVISVHSFRGGTGKSNTTANLAASTALRGKRVGIVDTDIQSPGIHVLFGLDEAKLTRSLNDYLWGRCRIGETAYDVTPPPVATAGGKMFLIPSSLRPGEIARILKEGYDIKLLSKGFRELIDHLQLDCLFIDTHPGLNEETLLSIAISDTLVLLLRPDKQDFQGTAVTVEVARKLKVNRMLLVANKVLPEVDAASLRRDIETAYRVPVAAVLPLTEDMVRLGSDGVFSLINPTHPLSALYRSLAATVTETAVE